jgi:hypothetical protein
MRRVEHSSSTTTRKNLLEEENVTQITPSTSVRDKGKYVMQSS